MSCSTGVTRPVPRVTIEHVVALVGHTTAGVVLVGGRSSRMGAAKAALEWHRSTLLRRTLGILARSIDGPLLVVRAPGQPLPEIPGRAQVVDDPEPGLGPLQAVATGLAALAGRAHAAFVCSTDLPFLHPAFVRRVLSALTDGVDVALPICRGYPQPLVAAYRITLAPLISDLVAAGDRRLALLFQQCATLRLDEATLLADPALATADPTLDSVVNVNSPDDYHVARCRPAPRVTVQCCGGETRTIRAATVSNAAITVGLALDSSTIVALNGNQIVGDQISDAADLPLVDGDVIVFSWATTGGMTRDLTGRLHSQ